MLYIQILKNEDNAVPTWKKSNDESKKINNSQELLQLQISNSWIELLWHNDENIVKLLLHAYSYDTNINGLSGFERLTSFSGLYACVPQHAAFSGLSETCPLQQICKKWEFENSNRRVRIPVEKNWN